MYGILLAMSASSDGAAREFGDALVREIRAEMARQGIHSVRALATRLGTNHAYWNDRLNGTTKTKKRVAIGLEDLYRVCAVLGVSPHDMVARASTPATQPPPESSVTDAG